MTAERVDPGTQQQLTGTQKLQAVMESGNPHLEAAHVNEAIRGVQRQFLDNQSFKMQQEKLV